MSEQENKNDLDLFIPGGYVAPLAKESVIEKETGKVEDIKSLPPLEQIKIAARRYSIPINDNPKKNCKKCLERGYVGFEAKDKTPIACSCMFPPKTLEEQKATKGQVPLSFLPKKAQRKFFREKQKQLKRELRKESTMRELRKIKDKMIDDIIKSATSGTDVSGTNQTQGEQAFAPATTENSGAIEGDKSPEHLPSDPTAVVEPIKESEENNGEISQG